MLYTEKWYNCNIILNRCRWEILVNGIWNEYNYRVIVGKNAINIFIFYEKHIIKSFYICRDRDGYGIF